MKDDKYTPSLCPKYGLHSHMVASEYREPFIDKGYRCENMGIVDCIKTMFVLKCNETFNIWTHLLPFILFAVKFMVMFTTELSLSDPFYWPLAANAVGIMGFCVTSALAHMFCAFSLKARHTCFYTDYAAISIYSVTAWGSTYFYGRSTTSTVLSFLYSNTRAVMLIGFLFSILSTVQCCSTRHMKSALRHAFRVLSFVVPWTFAAGPYIYRILTCDSELDCQYEAFNKFKAHGIMYLAGAIFMATKYPERLFPGKFDTFGHSHQIMHLCTAFGADIQFESIKLDMLRRESLLRSLLANETFPMDCVLFTIAVIVGNVMVAFVFNNVVDLFKGGFGDRNTYKKDD